MTTAEWVQLVADTLDKVVIPLVGLAIGWSITHWGLKQKAETTLARNDLIGQVAREAVKAAQQTLGGQDGAARRAAAMNFAAARLAAHGIVLTPTEEQALGAAIEAAVRDLKVGDALHAAALAPPAVTATPGPGQEASVVVQPASEPPASPAPGPATPPVTNDPTASKPVGAGTGVRS